MKERRVVKRVIVGGVLAGALAVTVSAQVKPEPSSPGGTNQEQVQAQARYKVFVMEGVLERAAQNGAAVFTRQVRALAPEAMFLSGAAQVRGFRLEGYGIFFDVEVPALRPTAARTLRAIIDDNGASIAQLKAYVRKVQDPRDREQLERAIRNLELQVPAGTRQVANDVTPQTVSAGGQTPAARPVAVPSDPLLLADPGAVFTREVKSALVDAMIENSGPLSIGPEEWLTIAARDSEAGNRLVPGDAYDLTTTVIRVKGSDLAAFHTKQITLEEARQRVEVKEF
jgi:hypothetical protein